MKKVGSLIDTQKNVIQFTHCSRNSKPQDLISRKVCVKEARLVSLAMKVEPL